MSSSAEYGHDHVPALPDRVRPLPPRPNLEFERKQAKRLLAALRRGDSDALERVRPHLGERGAPDANNFKLAEAQFAIAREYGFRSWPRLVEYFTTLERHERSGPLRAWRPPDMLESSVRSTLAQHRARLEITGRMLATFIPRFYGASLEQVFASPLTEDEARLLVARQSRAPSWQVLLEQRETRPREDWKLYSTPKYRAGRAIRNGDLAALQQIVAAHPELLEPPEALYSHDLLRGALHHEQRVRSPDARRISDWLVAQGGDLVATIGRTLISHPRASPDDVQFLIDRGADLRWTPPNGVSILEHALCFYWNGETVDLIARRIRPKRAFWIDAGLGDVKGLRRWFDHAGRLTDAARRHRPDFAVSFLGPLPSRPDADDEEIIWEAFFVAGINQRFAVLDALLERGFPIDYMGWNQTLLHFAVGNGKAPLVEYLVARGASLEVRGWRPNANAREMAESYYVAAKPTSPERARILALCGARDAETLRREKDARWSRPAPAPVLQRALELARSDAARQGRDLVTAENLLVGVIGSGAGLALQILAASGADVERLLGRLADRIEAPAETLGGPEVPLDPKASRIMRRMDEVVEERRSQALDTLHLLFALTESDASIVTELLRSSGVDRDRLREKVEGLL